MNDADRFTRGVPPNAVCACGGGCTRPPVWTHHFPNGSCTYLCDAGKRESERFYDARPSSS